MSWIFLLVSCLGIAAPVSGCQRDLVDANLLYDRVTFERGVTETVEEKDFSIVEAWGNAEHLVPVPEDVVTLHGDIDGKEEGDRFTAYLVAESEGEGIISIRYWVLDGRVGALTIFSTQKETLRSVQSDLKRKFPGIVIETEIKEDATEVRNAGSKVGRTDLGA